MFVNGVNIGRYWPSLGPQVRLFVPKYVLKEGSNTIALIELERHPCDSMEHCYITFCDKPLINSTVSPGDISLQVHGDIDKTVYRGNLTYFETGTKTLNTGNSKLSLFQMVYNIVMKIVESKWGVLLL
jgi:hypothetical protein